MKMKLKNVMACAVARLGDVFENKNQIQLMNYAEAMVSIEKEDRKIFR